MKTKADASADGNRVRQAGLLRCDGIPFESLKSHLACAKPALGGIELAIGIPIGHPEAGVDGECRRGCYSAAARIVSR
jgi:hypothetical protein